MPRGPQRLRAPDNTLNLVGKRVQERRIALKLTQDKLCARLAIASGSAWSPTRRDLFKIEDGLRSVHDTELVALAEALGCSACWLLTGMAQPER